MAGLFAIGFFVFGIIGVLNLFSGAIGPALGFCVLAWACAVIVSECT